VLIIFREDRPLKITSLYVEDRGAMEALRRDPIHLREVAESSA
jgi:hypothetical protein